MLLSEILMLFEEQEMNRKWFEKNHDSLVKKYDGKFIAICRQEVVDFDEDIGKLMERVERKHPPEKISVEYVTKEKLQLIL